MAAVELIAVTKAYGTAVAVDNIDLKIEDGSYCCLLGPSGCGKTSTLRMIAGHETITNGDILIGDTQVNGLPPAKRPASTRRNGAPRRPRCWSGCICPPMPTASRASFPGASNSAWRWPAP